MPFSNVRDYVEAYENTGARWFSYFYKTSTPAPAVAGGWVDLSMGAGIPTYNAYVGGQLEATALTGTGNRSIFIGPTTTGDKRLWSIGAMSTAAAVPATLVLLDYLMFYPLIDGDNTDLQEMIPTDTLPRFTTGTDVQMMVVCTTPMVSNATLTVSYTNSAGTAGRTTSASLIASTVVGNLVATTNTAAASGGRSAFLPLADGDAGVRSVESITLATASGGLFAIVLVKPLTTLLLREQNVYAEQNPFKEMARLPEIQAGAFLNFIANSQSTTALTTLRGELQFVWE